MKRGAMREVVTIESASTGRDEIGQPIAGWSVFERDIPAEMKDLSGREFLAASANQSAIQTRFVIDSLPGLTPFMRLKHEMDLYNIEAVLRSPDGRYFTLMCTRVIV